MDESQTYSPFRSVLLDDFTDITFLHFCCTLLYIQFSGKKLNKKVEVFL